jgi:hypothetical protein
MVSVKITKLGNSQDTEFIIENENNNKFLTGFFIITKDASEEVATFNATQKAINLSNFISVRYLHFVRPTFRGLSRLYDDGNSEVIGKSKQGWWYINKLDFDSNDKA